MTLELRCAATAIGRLPHCGPQSAVHVALTGSLLVADAEDFFQLLRQTDQSLGNEIAAKGYL
jgi:hypothetical protein